jgi:HNH endonuclease
MLALERLGARRQHIVPWSDCNDEQRLDVHNGLLLSALWDAAFDQGLVSFGDDGKPCVSPSLGEIAVIRGNVDSLMKLVAALDASGIELISDNATSSSGGRGVRLKRPPQ